MRHELPLIRRLARVCLALGFGYLGCVPVLLFTMGPGSESKVANHLLLLLVSGIVLVLIGYTIQWRTLLRKESALHAELERLKAKNQDMENWVLQLSRASDLLTDKKEGVSATVYDEMTKSLGEIRGKINDHFTQVFLDDRLNTIGMLASGVAHELNTPLTSLHFMLSAEKNISPEAKRNLLSEIDRMAGIARSLLAFARPSENSVLDLNQLVRSSKPLFASPRLANLQIQYELSSTPFWVHVVPSEIQQIFLNLFHNAVDALEGRENPQISIKTTHLEAHSAILSIKDNGCGIPPSALSKILDPFFTTKPSGKGTGLGLFIVHQIAHKHKITVGVDSEEGRGTTFKLIFPLTHERREAA